ncbi:MAG: VOC family protein [Actinomycetota bacterium]|nr:VOC family protein [Actinomycetota bacterium]
MFEKLIQVGFISREIDRVLKSYTDIYNIGPWYILKFCPDNVKSMEVYGKRQDYAMTVAVCPIADIRFEYIEPLTSSIFSDFYDDYGEYAVHHLKLGGQDYKTSLDFFLSKNIKAIQTGHQIGGPGKNIYTFMDTLKELGFITEIVEVTSNFIKPEPEKWYPCDKKDFEPLFKKASMVGILVKNLEDKIKEYEKLEIGPWQIIDFNEKNNSDLQAKIAFCSRDNAILKLIQPYPGSIFGKHLMKYGEGIHHIKMEVDNYKHTLEHLKSNGLEIIYSGKYLNESEFSFIDTRKHLNFIVEISDKKIDRFSADSLILHP